MIKCSSASGWRWFRVMRCCSQSICPGLLGPLSDDLSPGTWYRVNIDDATIRWPSRQQPDWILRVRWFHSAVQASHGGDQGVVRGGTRVRTRPTLCHRYCCCCCWSQLLARARQWWGWCCRVGESTTFFASW